MKGLLSGLDFMYVMWTVAQDALFFWLSSAFVAWISHFSHAELVGS